MTLKALLRQRNMMQKDLAKRTGIGADLISKYVNKKVKIGFKNAEKIAIALNVKIEDIENKYAIKPYYLRDEVIEYMAGFLDNQRVRDDWFTREDVIEGCYSEVLKIKKENK